MSKLQATKIGAVVLLAVTVYGGIAAMMIRNARKPVTETTHPTRRLSRVERDAIVAGVIKESVLAHVGEGDWDFHVLSVREEDGGRYSSFGSIKPASDKYSSRLSPWTAVVAVDERGPRVTFLTYGSGKEIIYMEK